MVSSDSGASRFRLESPFEGVDAGMNGNVIKVLLVGDQTVVIEEDDDKLVRDLQKILGRDQLNKLSLILKLIFLEGGVLRLDSRG